METTLLKKDRPTPSELQLCLIPRGIRISREQKAAEQSDFPIKGNYGGRTSGRLGPVGK